MLLHDYLSIFYMDIWMYDILHVHLCGAGCLPGKHKPDWCCEFELDWWHEDGPHWYRGKLLFFFVRAITCPTWRSLVWLLFVEKFRWWQHQVCTGHLTLWTKVTSWHLPDLKWTKSLGIQRSISILPTPGPNSIKKLLLVKQLASRSLSSMFFAHVI